MANAPRMAALHLGTALGIGGVLESARDRRIEHEDPDPRRQPDGLDVERSAVDSQRVAGNSERRGELIHRSAGHTDGTVLGPLTGEREILRVGRQTRDAAERRGEGDLERSRGRNARADRDVGADGSLDSHLQTPQLGELAVHGRGVATPRWTAFVEPTVRGELRHALEPLRAQDGSAVDSRR